MAWELELSGAEVLAFALAIACAGLLVALVMLWNRSPRGAAARGTATELDGLRQSIGQLEGELGRLVQDMNGRIDAKMRVLRGLLDGADAAVRQLRELRAAATPAVSAIAAKTSNESPRQAVGADSIPALDHSTKTRDPVRPNSSQTEPLDERTQRYSHVYSLADAGLDSAQISAETGMHRGEVELVLNLRRKKVRVDRAGRPEPAHIVSHLEEATA